MNLIKKIAPVLPLLFLVQGSVYSQDFSLYGNIGVRPTKIGHSSIIFHYVDESPSMDNITSYLVIDKKRRAINLNLGAEYKLPSDIFIRGGINFFPGKINGFDLELGGGYEIGFWEQTVEFRPSLVFGLGSASIDLGDINNNDLFIQVNGTKFYSNTVNVDLSNTFLEMKPSLEMVYNVKENIGISAYARYHLTLSQKRVNLIFRGELENGDTKSESETIFANNVWLDVNGSITESSIVGLSGIAIGLGAIYTF